MNTHSTALDYMNALRSDSTKKVEHSLNDSYARNCSYYIRILKRWANTPRLLEPISNYRAVRGLAIELNKYECGNFIAHEIGQRGCAYSDLLQKLLWCQKQLSEEEYRAGKLTLPTTESSKTCADFLSKLSVHIEVLDKLSIHSFTLYKNVVSPQSSEEIEKFAAEKHIDLDSRSIPSNDYLNLLSAIVGVALSKADSNTELGQINNEVSLMPTPKDILYSFVSSALAARHGGIDVA
ncbi:hypothetical protein VTH8203_01342 [Vibrio thalassae]|uniref:Uncharacterized protein n=1 Tax=Vibrio thalassae TaxID=1243014 RepID=A0A240EGA7_9VIBR|nr:hypothetical protein [Vibrio thalassae]SNX47727.1 hypothetical protein VTH8203_01342 [Vibrio thalassae]